MIIRHTLDTMFRVFPELRGTIDFTHVPRWRQALPLTSRGSYGDLDRFNAQMSPTSKMQFAADFMSAAGQNTAVEFGGRAARNLISSLEAAGSAYPMAGSELPSRNLLLDEEVPLTSRADEVGS